MDKWSPLAPFCARARKFDYHYCRYPSAAVGSVSESPASRTVKIFLPPPSQTTSTWLPLQRLPQTIYKRETDTNDYLWF